LQKEEGAKRGVQVRCQKFRILVSRQRGSKSLISSEHFHMEAFAKIAGNRESAVGTRAKGTDEA